MLAATYLSVLVLAALALAGLAGLVVLRLFRGRR